MPDLHTAQSVRFRVKIDGGNDLGDWSKCDGLSVEYDVFEYKEGGQNSFTHRIPGRVKYQNIKLTRPINKDSKQVADLDCRPQTAGASSDRRNLGAGP